MIVLLLKNITFLADSERLVVKWIPFYVIGIGALKYYGNRPAYQPGATCSPRGLQVRIEDLLGKSDEQIGGDYAATQVSDRLLLVGFMRALAIDEVRLVDVDLTDGLLFESEFWPRNVAGGGARALP